VRVSDVSASVLSVVSVRRCHLRRGYVYLATDSGWIIQSCR